jgi:hypothetical protein
MLLSRTYACSVKYQISRSGGAWPIWASNGSELIYRLSNAAANTNGGKFTSEKELTIAGFVPMTNYREYDMLPNGKEFVMVFPAVQQPSPGPAPLPSIHVVENWFEELKARVPTH